LFHVSNSSLLHTHFIHATAITGYENTKYAGLCQNSLAVRLCLNEPHM